MASSRFGGSSLHQRDARSALFEGYSGGAQSQSSRNGSASPGGGYGYPGGGNGNGLGVGGQAQAYRPATPNSRGQYSTAALEEMEAGSEARIGETLSKVGQLKSMALGIGEHIRTSTLEIAQMNDEFDDSRGRIKGTMRRMQRMADSTGVGWKAWLAFFAAVGLLFFYVWVF